MRAAFIISGFLLALAAAPALAAPGTQAQRSACTDDAYRFCEPLIPDAVQVESCLRRNLPHLSRACRAQFGEAGGKRHR